MPNPVVTFEMENGGVIKAELYPEIAPNTVNNFLSLVNSGFYDGLIFHRVIPGFMIQGGDPQGTGMGGPGYRIKGEFKHNGFSKNNLKHDRGVLSMARSMMPDTAGRDVYKRQHSVHAELRGKAARRSHGVRGAVGACAQVNFHAACAGKTRFAAAAEVKHDVAAWVGGLSLIHICSSRSRR